MMRKETRQDWEQKSSALRNYHDFYDFLETKMG